MRSANQQFLKTFTYMEWRRYSGLSHGASEAFIGMLGMVPIGAYFMDDFVAREVRDKLDGTYDLFVSAHIGRSSSVLLCMLTEVQASCKFDGADINDRICKIWGALLPLPETKELYDGRYGELMRNRGIITSANEDLLNADGADTVTQ